MSNTTTRPKATKKFKALPAGFNCVGGGSSVVVPSK